ncbi:hypothetical protein [Roseobacter sp. N2S]|uniref:hypothetical protein n=1 Tax=Roseobacter sp. N2S TaxID=2663844 RepID=UPI0028660498|nr:hypothetical protein [Roseobacter sp. N2S]MDR6266742.1 hypothetical protein [Roseobacter sp. N2S]
MRIAVSLFALAALALPNSALAQGLFAFEGAPPAEGGFDRPYAAPFSAPVQSTLQEVPALDGPYGNTLPSLTELGTLGTDAEKRPAQGPAPESAAQITNVPPATSLRPRMNPLREPVREKRKVGRFLRRFVVNPLRQKPQASKQNNHTNSQPGNPVP